MAGTPVLNLGPDELLTTTRSVRKRLHLDRPVPLELVQECLEIALQAPSASNIQHWHFVVVTDPGDRATIGDYYLRSFTDYMASKQAAGNPYADDPERTATHARIEDSSTHLAEVMGRVPVLVIPCIDSGAEALPAENQSGLWGSVLPAAWSYMLAARARGLGVAWTTLHQRFEPEIGELLGIPKSVHQGALLPTAYFTGETFRPAKRQPLDQVLHVGKW
jgi:nitroreductase